MLKLFLGAVLVCTLAFASTENLDRSDSGIKGPKYSVILKQAEDLAKQYPDLTMLVDYGKSVQGRTLRMLVILKKNRMPLAERPTLIMSGSTHGNEYLNLEDRLPAEFLKKTNSPGGTLNDFLDQGGAIVTIPILNPDGYENAERENAHGVDLNRDWDVKAASFKGFKEVETRALALKLEELTRPPFNFRFRATVDYHCCIGAILYPWSYTDATIPESDKSAFVGISQMADKHLNIDSGTTGQILGYHAIGTTKDYYYDRYRALSFTYEGRFEKENLNFDRHVAWWDDLFNYFSRERIEPIFSTFKRRLHPFIRIAD